jgi:hypothetical protein
MAKDYVLITGFIWNLKNDKTHDKFEVTYQEKGALICNEKLYSDDQFPEDTDNSPEINFLENKHSHHCNHDHGLSS